MRATKLLVGNTLPFTGLSFCRSVAINQLAFLANRCIFQSQRKESLPAEDPRIAAIAAARTDANGMVQPTRYDDVAIGEAWAAAYTLLTRVLHTPDPDTGKKPEHLLRYLKGPADVTKDAYDFSYANRMREEIANAAVVGAKTDKRLAAIAVELQAFLKTNAQLVSESFYDMLPKTYDMEDGKLADIVIEALHDAKKDVATEVQRAAAAFIGKAKEMVEAGRFMRVDPIILTLAGIPAPAVVAPPAPADMALAGPVAAPKATHTGKKK